HALAVTGRVLRGALLEIGAGPGLLTQAMATHANFDAIVATDVSLGFLLGAKARLESVSMPAHAFVACDAHTLPFRTSAFDVVLGRSVLHHLLHYKRALERTRDIL